MISYIIRRLILSFVVLVGVSIFTFLLTVVVPSDPAYRWVGPRARPEQLAAARIELGLDKPVHIRYLMYVKAFMQGDLGTSIVTHQPVLKDLLTYLPASLELITFGMLLAIIIGVPLGVLSSAKGGTLLDHTSRIISVTGVAIPTFWLGMILQIVFVKGLRLFPLAERMDTLTLLTNPIKEITGFYFIDSLLTGNFIAFGDALYHIFLPGITLAAYALGLTARMTRATMMEVLREDYIRTARACGIIEIKIFSDYALRNAMGPVMTALALTLAYSLVETFLIESIFVWPGLGYYASKAIIAVDYPAIMGITLFIAVTYILLNLLVDILQAVLDPRIRV